MDRQNLFLQVGIFALLILLSVGNMTGRLAKVTANGGQQTPFLSANDRSRWCTIRALVDFKTYAIDDVLRQDDSPKFHPAWQTIDMVRHRGGDGKEHYYSSKPTLFPTILAGKYWILKNVLGWSLEKDAYLVGRFIIFTTNILPLILMFFLLGKFLLETGGSLFANVATMAIATHGTYLTTYAITLNNHLPAAVATFFALYIVYTIFEQEKSALWRYWVLGFLAGFAGANELPALAFIAFLTLFLFWYSWKKTTIAYLPALVLVGSCALGTNYIAHGSLSPPYMHRQDGPVIVAVDRSQIDWTGKDQGAKDLGQILSGSNEDVSSELVLTDHYQEGRSVLFDKKNEKRYAVLEKGAIVEIRSWNNWYDYSKSYWTPSRRSGVDKGEPSQGVYLFHVLIGHHGLFSLTPVLIFSCIGLALCCGVTQNPFWQFIGWTGLGLLVILLVFYVGLRPQIDRNYGGVTTGLRWFFWLYPFWLLGLVVSLQMFEKSRLLIVLFGMGFLVSLFSVSYGGMNPWTQPWIFDLLTYFGWISY
ncbi:MAG: hypothetical protein MPJ24_09950 [Pirellulaceae bacterium]|nr:hypothetical protein [Pirellulaceae bacterium]